MAEEFTPSPLFERVERANALVLESEDELEDARTEADATSEREKVYAQHASALGEAERELLQLTIAVDEIRRQLDALGGGRSREDLERDLSRKLDQLELSLDTLPSEVVRTQREQVLLDPPRDYSVYDTSYVGPSAGLVSTMEDLDRFYAGLLAGRIVSPASLAEMQRTGPVIALDGSTVRYGLGLHRLDVPGCGTFWGHDGSAWGAGTVSFTRADGRRQAGPGGTPLAAGAGGRGGPGPVRPLRRGEMLL